tara:strand:- start:1278 stop:2621 length:1344 start_codon:yes stop_codon:yes gene_type:complete
MNRATRRRIARLVKRQQKKGIMPRRNDPILQALRVLDHLYKDNTEAPEELQRPLSWKDKNKIDFFNSICMNRISGEIILVNVQKALDSLEDEAGKKANEAYALIHKAITLFKDCLDRGHDYIVLDGNNRLTFYLDLLNGRWEIPAGTYEYIREKNDPAPCVFTVTDQANKFVDLPRKVQNSLLDRMQIITEYTQIDWIGMSLVFINTNSMVAPNAQEIRNASVSDWADYIRTIRKNNGRLLRMLFENPLNRLAGDEWIVDCLDLVIQGIQDSETPVTFERKINEGIVDAEDKSIEEEFTGYANCRSLTQTSKFDLYDCDLVSNADYYESIFESLEDWLSKMIDAASTKEGKKALKTKSLTQNLFWMMCNGINSYADAVKAVKLHQEAYANENFRYGPDKATFKNACSGSSAANIEFRYIVLSRIIEEVHKDVLKVVNPNWESKEAAA